MYSISVEELLKRQEKETIQIIDIREEYEFEDESIETSTNIPMDDVAQNPDLLKDTSVLVCQTGKRAESLCFILRELKQQENVFFLDGGYEAYNNKVN